MQYFGGKSRISVKVAERLNSMITPGALYVEPFCGACWVAHRISAERKLLNDLHPELIAMWQSLQQGWNPPMNVSEDLYRESKVGNVDPMTRGFVGFACSFSGKWFGGYARNNRGTNYAKDAISSLSRKIPNLSNAIFTCCDYRMMRIPNGSVVYCDPPYSQTTQYSVGGTFDRCAFWEWVRNTSNHSMVLVSEYSAPPDFESVLDIYTNTEIRNSSGNREPRVERLYRMIQ